MKFCGFDSIKLSEEKYIFTLSQKNKINKLKKKNINKKEKIKINLKKPLKNTKITIKNEESKQKVKADPNSPFAVLGKLL